MDLGAQVVRAPRPRRGKLVLLVGPDGSGKTTLASSLVEELAERFNGATRLHWRPSILPPAGSFIGRSVGDPSTPHAQVPHGPVLSLLVLLYYWFDFFLGGWLKLSTLLRRGVLVVMERGWQDIGVDARRYRLQMSPRVVFALSHLLRHPDLVLVLQAPEEVLLGRKQELAAEELERQSDVWRRIRFPKGTSVVYLDASVGASELLEESKGHILELADRHR